MTDYPYYLLDHSEMGTNTHQTLAENPYLLRNDVDCCRFGLEEIESVMDIYLNKAYLHSTLPVCSVSSSIATQEDVEVLNAGASSIVGSLDKVVWASKSFITLIHEFKRHVDEHLKNVETILARTEVSSSNN